MTWHKLHPFKEILVCSFNSKGLWEIKFIHTIQFGIHYYYFSILKRFLTADSNWNNFSVMIANQIAYASILCKLKCTSLALLRCKAFSLQFNAKENWACCLYIIGWTWKRYFITYRDECWFITFQNVFSVSMLVEHTIIIHLFSYF